MASAPAGSCCAPRPSLADYVMGTGTPRGASAAGGGPSVDYPLPIGLLVLATGCSEGPPLDEDCMKDRGWVVFGGDIGPAVKAPEPSAGKTKGKY